MCTFSIKSINWIKPSARRIDIIGLRKCDDKTHLGQPLRKKNKKKTMRIVQRMHHLADISDKKECVNCIDSMMIFTVLNLQAMPVHYNDVTRTWMCLNWLLDYIFTACPELSKENIKAPLIKGKLCGIFTSNLFVSHCASWATWRYNIMYHTLQIWKITIRVLMY